jgi:hypothetical protein
VVTHVRSYKMGRDQIPDATGLPGGVSRFPGSKFDPSQQSKK